MPYATGSLTMTLDIEGNVGGSWYPGENTVALYVNRRTEHVGWAYWIPEPPSNRYLSKNDESIVIDWQNDADIIIPLIPEIRSTAAYGSQARYTSDNLAGVRVQGNGPFIDMGLVEATVTTPSQAVRELTP